jgi:hypothetical protein
LPSIALGTAIAVGLLGASAVALGLLGGRAEASNATLPDENTIGIWPSKQAAGFNFFYCGAGDRYWWLQDEQVALTDPRLPGAPEIRTSWTIEAGATTTFSPSGYASYVCPPRPTPQLTTGAR